MANPPRRGPGHGPGRGFQKPKNLKKTIGTLLGYIGRSRYLLIFVALCVVLNSLCSILGSYLLKPLINDCIVPGDYDRLIRTLVLMALVYVTGALLSFTYARIMVRVSQRTTHAIRQDLFQKMQRLPLSYFDTHSHGDHIGGHARIRNLTNLKVAAHKSSAPKVTDPVPYAVETRTKFPGYSPAPQVYLQGVPVDRVLEDGEVIAGRLQVIHTPGHDDDCVCWYDIPTGTLITGDSLQGNGTPAQGVGFYKNLDEYLCSLRKLQQIQIDHVICGHDYDEIGWNISGAEAVRSALQCCQAAVERYHDFILQQYQAGVSDPVEVALALIRKYGCAMPDKLFLALYTVTQHLGKIESTRQ